jgi:hypothetical protein
MRLGNDFWNSGPVKALFFALFTLSAGTTEAFLFILVRRAPQLRGAPATTYYPALLISLLPWLSGCVFWIKVRKRAKLGKTDRGTAGFCYNIIFLSVLAAYLAVLQIGILLLRVLTGAG